MVTMVTSLKFFFYLWWFNRQLFFLFFYFFYFFFNYLSTIYLLWTILLEYPLKWAIHSNLHLVDQCTHYGWTAIFVNSYPILAKIMQMCHGSFFSFQFFINFKLCCKKVTLDMYLMYIFFVFGKNVPLPWKHQISEIFSWF